MAGSTEKFFAPQLLQGQKGVRQPHQRHMTMPTPSTAAFVVIQPRFLFELLIVVFDLAAAFGGPHQAPQGVLCRQVTEEVLGGLRLGLRPLH